MSSGFDSLIFRLGSFAKSAEKKTQQLIEISQLKWKMAKLKSKIERKYTKIGSITYSHQKNMKMDCCELFKSKINAICQEIDDLFLQLKCAECEYDEIKKKSLCQNQKSEFCQSEKNQNDESSKQTKAQN